MIFEDTRKFLFLQGLLFCVFFSLPTYNDSNSWKGGMILPKEWFPTMEIQAMLPYVDRSRARFLELCLTVEKLHTLAVPAEQELHELEASEAGMDGGGRMDMEGMLQAVQAVARPEERRQLEQMRMFLQMSKLMTGASGPGLSPELLGALLGPEQKKQMDEILPLISMMQEGKMPL